MNKTIALSAILISLSTIMIGSVIIMNLPDVDEFFYTLCGIIFILSSPGLIATLVALLKNMNLA